MLNLFGRLDHKGNHCDGVTRRGFLKVGGMAAGGCACSPTAGSRGRGPGPARRTRRSSTSTCRAARRTSTCSTSSRTRRPRSAGEFRPIATNVPGMQICELFPQAGKDGGQVRDRPFARRFRGAARLLPVHDRAGTHKATRHPAGGWPAFGAWVSKLQGRPNPAMPANISLMYPTGNRTWGEPGTGGFVGTPHAPMGLVAERPERPRPRA